MAKDKTWGDGFVIEAAALLYQRPILLFLAGQNSPVTVSSNSTSATSPVLRPMCLGYVAVGSEKRNHYVSLKRQGEYLFICAIGWSTADAVIMPCQIELAYILFFKSIFPIARH